MSEDGSFVLLPPGTVVHEPNESDEVVIRFPNAEDAAIFWEFLRGFCSGDFGLEAVEKDGQENQ